MILLEESNCWNIFSSAVIKVSAWNIHRWIVEFFCTDLMAIWIFGYLAIWIYLSVCQIFDFRFFPPSFSFFSLLSWSFLHFCFFFWFLFFCSLSTIFLFPPFFSVLLFPFLFFPFLWSGLVWSGLIWSGLIWFCLLVSYRVSSYLFLSPFFFFYNLFLVSCVCVEHSLFIYFWFS